MPALARDFVLEFIACQQLTKHFREEGLLNVSKTSSKTCQDLVKHVWESRSENENEWCVYVCARARVRA